MRTVKSSPSLSVWPELPPPPPKTPQKTAEQELADFVLRAECELTDPQSRPVYIEVSDDLMTWYGSPVKALADRMKAMKAKGYKVRIARFLFTNYVEIDWEV